jgi:N-acetyl-anhydromuramyl-L-alanine amidase AmpD
MTTKYKPGGVTVTIGRSQNVALPPRVFRGRATCMHFDTDKSFLLPPSVNGVRNIVTFFNRHPDTNMLVNGHTDLVGDSQYNLQLSNERAAAVAAYLMNKVDDWLAWYSASIPSKRWSCLEDQYMLQTICDAQGAPYYTGPTTGYADPATQDAVKRFQADNGLASGQLDNDTRRALITKYMALEGTSLPATTTLVQHGCGKFHPIDPTAAADQGNRRVEIFLFDGPIDPPPQTTCPAGGCKEYLAWVGNPDEDIDLCQQQSRTFDLALLVEDEASPPNPIGGAQVGISAPGIAAITVGSDGRGTIDNVPEGTWQLTASHPGFATRTQSITIPGSSASTSNAQAFASKAKTGGSSQSSTTSAVVVLAPTTPILLVQAQPHFALRSAPKTRRMTGREVGAGHNFTLRDTNSPPTFSVTKSCSSDGKASFDISSAADGSYVLELHPASGQDLGGPPTPGTPSASPPNQMFNLLTVDLQITGQQVTSASIAATSLHGNVVDQQPLKLLIDWKPEWIATTFHSARPGGGSPSVLVLHRTDNPANAPMVINGFITGPSKASAHYVVDVDGLVVKMIQDSEVANHAGGSFFGGRGGVNDFSIGVEICNVVNTEFPADQQAGVIALVRRILNGASICRHRVVGHGDVGMEAVDDMGFVRRLDPGKEFFWPALEIQSLAMKAPATPSGGPALSSSNYNEFFTQAPGSGKLRIGDSDNRMVWGGKQMKNTPNGTLIAQSLPITQLQEDLSKIGYFVNSQKGEFTTALAHTVMHLQHRVFTGSNFIPTGMTGPLPDRRSGRPHLETGDFDVDTARMLLGMLDDLSNDPCP